MPIPHVVPGQKILAPEQNALIDQVNANTTAVAGLGGGSSVNSFTHVQSGSLAVITIFHGMSYRPAGINAIDSLDNPTEYESVRYPTASTVEVRFGAPFSGTIYLS